MKPFQISLQFYSFYRCKISRISFTFMASFLVEFSLELSRIKFFSHFSSPLRFWLFTKSQRQSEFFHFSSVLWDSQWEMNSRFKDVRRLFHSSSFQVAFFMLLSLFYNQVKFIVKGNWAENVNLMESTATISAAELVDSSNRQKHPSYLALVTSLSILL